MIMMMTSLAAFASMAIGTTISRATQRLITYYRYIALCIWVQVRHHRNPNVNTETIYQVTQRLITYHHNEMMIMMMMIIIIAIKIVDMMTVILIAGYV